MILCRPIAFDFGNDPGQDERVGRDLKGQPVHQHHEEHEPEDISIAGMGRFRPESDLGGVFSKIDFKINFGYNFLMDRFLPSALSRLELAAGRRGLNRGAWAQHAGVRAETLSRLFRREDCDLGTLTRLACAAGQQLVFVDAPQREMPSTWDRDVEHAYLELCASGSTDLGRWLRAGPRYFTSGLATMMASSRGCDRAAYLALAFALCPAMQDAAELQTWLSMSPAQPARFLPMVLALASR